LFRKKRRCIERRRMKKKETLTHTEKNRHTINKKKNGKKIGRQGYDAIIYMKLIIIVVIIVVKM
jgi:hypothetical protein